MGKSTCFDRELEKFILKIISVSPILFYYFTLKLTIQVYSLVKITNMNTSLSTVEKINPGFYQSTCIQIVEL